MLLKYVNDLFLITLWLLNIVLKQYIYINEDNFVSSFSFTSMAELDYNIYNIYCKELICTCTI